ncbi:hypothetical protein DEO72_LG1g2588 [Vigna unguiculata]|uniref:Uncharacterized protein n=1 Tax=Vigna unguiculata TaxID=3917 RepID=A0A4D6KN30_VIGUN|nr:hypothetical protein DEO72_LG1g2588 [Vigna unguiculata]
MSGAPQLLAVLRAAAPPRSRSPFSAPPRSRSSFTVQNSAFAANVGGTIDGAALRSVRTATPLLGRLLRAPSAGNGLPKP